MRVTIIRDDNTVIVDGIARTVDCTGLQAPFHALQWDGTRGEIEYYAMRCEHCGVRSKKGNALVSDLAPFQPYLDAWHVEDARVKAEEAAAEAERVKITEANAAAVAAQVAERAARVEVDAAAVAQAQEVQDNAPRPEG